MGQISSVQIGKPKTYEGVSGVPGTEKPWTTAIYKEPVEGSAQVTKFGIEGDGQADLKNHGGHDKAICVYTAEHYDHWQNEIGFPSDFHRGAFGENLTVGGLDEQTVCVGDIWQVGTTWLQVSQPRQPCWKLARRWGVKDLALQVQQSGFTGWYLRVLQEGELQAGDSIHLIECPLPEWSLEKANSIMHHQKHDRAAALELASVELLSESWQDQLKSRVAKLDAV